MLGPADYIVDLGYHIVRAFPGCLQLQRLPSCLGQVVQPDLVSPLESSRAGYTDVAGLHPVVHHLQILTGIMVDVLQPFHEVHYEVGHRVLLVWGSPKTAGCRADIAPFRTPCWWAPCLWSCGWMLCRPAGRWVGSHPNLFGSTKRPSTGAPSPS
jgi:hypothetical protein